MTLNDWASTFDGNENDIEIKKSNKTRRKVTDFRQFDSMIKDDDDELSDFVPNAILTKTPVEKTFTPPAQLYEQPLLPKPAEIQYNVSPALHTGQPMYMPPQTSGKDTLLLDKINYMIRLLEDQKDEKTGHVTEELILYAFLGIFVIFVLDSFVKTGKYVR